MDHCFLAFSPRKSSTCPHTFACPSPAAARSRLESLSDKPRRKGSSGASLDDVPLASGQARQRLTSSVACEESAHLSFVQNEPLNCTLSVQERFRSTSTRCEAGLLHSLRARIANKLWTQCPRATLHPVPPSFGYVHDRVAFISVHHSHTPRCSRAQIYHLPRSIRWRTSRSGRTST